jgi:hypothetical protein
MRLPNYNPTLNWNEFPTIVPDYPKYPHLGVNTEVNRANEDALRGSGFQDVIFSECYSAEKAGAFHCIYPQVDY